MARIYVLLPLRRPPSIRQPEKRLTLPTTAAVRSISALTKPEVGMLGGRHTRNQAVRCHWRIPLASYSHLRRTFSGIPSSRFAPSASSPSPSSPSPTEQEAVNEPRLSLTFTCTASITSPDVSSGPSGANASSEPLPVHQCRHRSSHTFTKRAYEKGIVIIACPSCKNRHLIADNLGWFKNQDGSEGGKTVEDFVRANGETVKRGSLFQTSEGDIEFAP